MKVRINVAARSMTLEWNTQIHALEKKADEMEVVIYVCMCVCIQCNLYTVSNHIKIIFKSVHLYIFPFKLGLIFLYVTLDTTHQQAHNYPIVFYSREHLGVGMADTLHVYHV